MSKYSSLSLKIDSVTDVDDDGVNVLHLHKTSLEVDTFAYYSVLQVHVFHFTSRKCAAVKLVELRERFLVQQF